MLAVAAAESRAQSVTLSFANGATVAVTPLAPWPGVDSLCLPARVRFCQVTPRLDTARRFLVRVAQGTRAVEWPVRAADVRQAYALLDLARARNDSVGPVALDPVRASLRCDPLACGATMTSPTLWGSNYAYLRPGPLPKSTIPEIMVALWRLTTSNSAPSYAWRQP